MHLDWKWNKQRPHFIAEGLSDFFDIKVIYMASKDLIFKNSSNSTTNEKNLNITPIFRMPFYENQRIYNLNRYYMRSYLKFLIKRYDPDFLWITFPQLYDYIPSNTRCKLIYDCMDLATAFDFNDDFKDKLTKIEEKLINDSSIIFVSSNSLFTILNEKYHCEDKLLIVRNAFGGTVIDNNLNNNTVEKKSQNYKIGFFGSISKAFIDFKKIKITLEEIDNIEYHLIGPVNEDVKSKHDRLKFYGMVNYNELGNYVKNFDCFILPFNLDDFRRASDPVKLYEYINYNKPIISVYYDELEYFSNFLYFYSNTVELLDILNDMVINGFVRKYSPEDRFKFLENNSWDNRVLKIVKYLNNLQ